MPSKTLFFACLTIVFDQVVSQCTPSDLDIVNFSDKIRRSVPCVLEVTAKKCPGLTDFYYKWEILEYYGRKVIKNSTESFIYIDGYTIDSEDVYLKGYLVVVLVSHYPDLTAPARKSRAFAFQPDNMHIEIVGGTEKTHLFNTDLTVDGLTLSKDTSYPPEEDAFAGNEISWTVDPPLPGIGSDSLVLKVPKTHLKMGKEYNFTLKVVRKKILHSPDEQTATQTVTIVSSKLPEINIKCVRNCLNSHPKETTIMKSVCVKNCNNLYYKWVTVPRVDPKKTDFGNGFDKLILLPDAFKAGDRATVKVKFAGASATYKLSFVDDIKLGSCDVAPKSGTSGITKFKVSCRGFSSRHGIASYMMYQKSDEVPGGVLLNEDASSEESEIYLSEGHPAEITVRIQDHAFIQAEIKLTVEVKPFSPSGGGGESAEIDAIKKLIFGDDSDSIHSFSQENSRNRVVQMASYLLDCINSLKGIDESVKRMLQEEIAKSIRRVIPNDYPSAIQIVSILEKLQKLKTEVDTLTSNLISRSVLNAAIALHGVTIYEKIEVPILFQQIFADSIFRICSDLLKETPEIKKILSKETEVHHYDSYDEMVSEKLRIRDDLRQVINHVIVTLEAVGVNVLHLNVPGQRPILIETDLISYLTKRVHPKALANESITISNATKSFARLSKSLVEELAENYTFVDYQFAAFKESPFWWHRETSRLNTDFVLLDFFENSIRISTMKNPLELNLQVRNVPVGTLRGSLNGSNSVQVHRIQTEPGAALMFSFKVPQGGRCKVAISDCYCTEEDFSRALEIDPGADENRRTIRADPKDGKNAIYVCVKNIGKSSVQYEGTFASFSCVYWNLRTGTWCTDGCRVKRAILENGSFLQCECWHASFFSGEIFVPPNKINFNAEIDFYIVIVRNWAMVVVVCSLFSIWFLLLVAAWFRDEKFQDRNFICVLDDNVPGDEHLYLMVVFTGVFLDAETTADVAFQVIGQKSKSRIHWMKCCGTRLLRRNAQDWIVFYTPKELGKIVKIRLWHNCKGKRPHWYCSRILIEHLKSGNQFCFVVDKWFSLIWGNGRIYRELSPQKEDELKSARILFSVKLETQLKDKHIWLSILARDPQSNFTSVERVSCAISFLFLSMLASAMFYGIPKNSPADSIDEKSTFFINNKDVLVVVESFLVTFPLSFLITLIFRNSGPRG